MRHKVGVIIISILLGIICFLIIISFIFPELGCAIIIIAILCCLGIISGYGLSKKMAKEKRKKNLMKKGKTIKG